jgi:hypothetical protein
MQNYGHKNFDGYSDYIAWNSIFLGENNRLMFALLLVGDCLSRLEVPLAVAHRSVMYNSHY